MVNLSLAYLSVEGCYSQSPMVCHSMSVTMFKSATSQFICPMIMADRAARAYCAGFSSFLSATVVFHSAYYSSHLIASIIIPIENSTFAFCHFANVTIQASKGSAVTCTSASIFMTLMHCAFLNCSVITSPCAGAILTYGSLSISSCCFDHCYKNYEGDNYFSNAIYANGSQFALYQSMFNSCGTSNTSFGDSTFYDAFSLIDVYGLNCTFCLGYMGGAGGRMDYSLSGSRFRYGTVCTSGGDNSIQFLFSSNTNPSFFNIINNSCFFRAWIYVDSATITVSYFVFWGNSKNNLYFIQNNGSVTAVGCLCDYSGGSYEVLTYSANPLTVTYGYVYSHGCIYATQFFTSSGICMSRELFFFSVSMFIFVFIK